MIRVYTSEDKVKNGKKVIDLNDNYFDVYFKEFTDKDLEVLKEVENAKYIEGNLIKSPYGYCSIYDMSTGTKTIINVINNPDIIFDVTECGKNALTYLFEEINDTDIEVILRHSSFVLPEGKEILVNNGRVIDRTISFGVELDK